MRLSVEAHISSLLGTVEIGHCGASGSLREFYEENGYLVVTDARSDQELDELCGEATSICRSERGAVEGFVPRVEHLSK